MKIVLLFSLALCCAVDALTLPTVASSLRASNIGTWRLASLQMAEAPDETDSSSEVPSDVAANPPSLEQPGDKEFWDFGGADSAPPFYMALAPGLALVLGRFVIWPLISGDAS